MLRVLVSVVFVLVVASCRSGDGDAPRCVLHDRPLVARRTTVDTTTHCGIPIDGYDDAQAARFPNTFRRPTRGRHGAEATAEHCVACTLARAAWLDDRFSTALPADRDGFVDALRRVDADVEAVSDALEVALTARSASLAACTLDDRAGYARYGDADRGVTEIWWDDGRAAGHTDVAVRMSPHDEDLAHELLAALEAELARAR